MRTPLGELTPVQRMGLEAAVEARAHAIVAAQPYVEAEQAARRRLRQMVKELFLEQGAEVPETARVGVDFEATPPAIWWRNGGSGG